MKHKRVVLLVFVAYLLLVALAHQYAMAGQKTVQMTIQYLG